MTAERQGIAQTGTSSAGYGIRELAPEDSISDLTRLLHQAYAQLADLGFRYKAVDQSDEVTLERARQGICLVARDGGGRLLGTVSLRA